MEDFKILNDVRDSYVNGIEISKNEEHRKNSVSFRINVRDEIFGTPHKNYGLLFI